MNSRNFGCSTLVVTLALGLAACGGGGGSPGSSSAAAPSAGSADGESQPEGDYRRLYSGLGLMPAGLSDGLTADAAVEDAVAPGYLALAALTASADLRLNLQAFEWALPQLVRKAAEQGDWQPDQSRTVECSSLEGDGSGQAAGSGSADVHYSDAYADGSLEHGEVVRFDFGDCRPSGGMRQLSSSEAQQFMFEGSDYRFLLRGVSMAGYQGLRIGSSDWVTRYYLESRSGCGDTDPETGQGVDECEQMVLTNQSSTNTDGSPSRLLVEQSDRAQPLRLAIWSNGTATVVGAIESYVVPAHQATVFHVSRLDLHLDPGADNGMDRAGHYTFRTQAGGLMLTYESRNFALADFSVLDGGFSVTTPAGTVYSYQIDPDPLYLRVSVDGRYAGRIAQELVTQRLRLMD